MWIYLTITGRLTAGSARDAVEERDFPDVRARAWFDARARLCMLALERVRWEFDLTPGATCNPLLRHLIEAQGDDPKAWLAAALAAHVPQPRPRGRPAGMFLVTSGNDTASWSTAIAALSVFFEVKRLEYLQVQHPMKVVGHNRDKSKVDISRRYHLGETLLAAK